MGGGTAQHHGVNSVRVHGSVYPLYVLGYIFNSQQRFRGCSQSSTLFTVYKSTVSGRGSLRLLARLGRCLPRLLVVLGHNRVKAELLPFRDVSTTNQHPFPNTPLHVFVKKCLQCRADTQKNVLVNPTAPPLAIVSDPRPLPFLSRRPSTPQRFSEWRNYRVYLGKRFSPGQSHARSCFS